MKDSQVIKDLKESAELFNKHIKDKLTSVVGGSIETVEGVTDDDMMLLLDRLSGIDLWHINKNIGIRGVGSRIQKPKISGLKEDWRTFTIRKERESGAKTEYAKRKDAIEKNYLYPYLTLQAYISYDNKLLSFAIARTKDIIECIDKKFCSVRYTRDKKGWATFYTIKWDEMEKNNYKIVRYINE